MSYFKSIWGDYFFSFLVLILGLGTSLFVSISYQQRWIDRQHAQFTQVANDRIELIRSGILNTNIVLRSLASFYMASHDVTRTEFQTFSRSLIADSPSIEATIWIPIIMDKDREAYEKAARAWDPEYTIREFGPDGIMMTSPRRQSYTPLYYTEPQRSNTYLGFDYATEPARNAVLEQAKVTKTSAATGRIELLRDKRPGIILAHPIFKAAKEPGTLLGYVLTIVPMDKLIDSALKPLQIEGVNILIHDRSADTATGQVLYARSTGVRSVPTEEILADYDAGDRLSQSALLNVNGRTWDVTVQSARGFFEISIQKTTYAVLATGIGFSLLLFTFMYTRVRENERIGHRVYARTKELQQAKNQIETILFSTNDGVLCLDKSANITFCNPTAARLLGYSRQWDMLNQNYHALIAHTREDGEKYDATVSAVSRALTQGESATVSDEVYWRRDETPLQIEYTVSPIIDENEVAGAVITFRDISERKKMEKKLEQMARYDQLTGLANRLMFVDQLRKSIARAKRNDKKVGVVYIDLNNFKPINDTMGHSAGDMVLKAFADRLNKSAREYDLPARLGGDEFTIMVDNIEDTDGCVKVVERLLENLKPALSINDKNIEMAGSIGIALYPDNAEDLDELISHADTAMYKAKKDKSQPYVIYSDDKNAA